MENKALILLVTLFCWCMITPRCCHAVTRLDDFRHRFIDSSRVESDLPRKRRPLNTLTREPEAKDYHFATGLFRKRVFNAADGDRFMEDPGLYAYVEE